MQAVYQENYADLSAAARLRVALVEMALRDEADEDREACKSLHEFTRRAWPIIEPATPFVDNWHIGAIAEHLTAVRDGQIRNLLITMPPRHYKSGEVSVMFPVWLWTELPHWSFVYSSYAANLSIRDALKSRRLIRSRWFQARWGDKFQLTGDQNAKTRYDNDRAGYRIATSVDGQATGEGGTGIISDDPHNMREIHSEVIRKGVLEWWDEVMSTRLNDPKKGFKIVVMQRGHHSDLAGHILKEKDDYVHLNLPAEYEGSKNKTSIGWSDPRKKKGELLWPARFGIKEIETLKKDLGSYGTAAQLQQRPTPQEGGIFKKKWFKLWPWDVKLPTLHTVIQSYDTAFTELTANDPSAGTTWGVFMHPKHKCNCIMLLDAWNERLEYTDLRKKVRAEAKARFGEDIDKQTQPGKRVDLILIENKGSGITLLRDLQSIGVEATPYNPNRADKTVRAYATQPFAEAGLIYLMESKGRPGEEVTWASPFLNQTIQFAPGKNANDEDDYVDTLTQLVIYLRDTYVLEAKAGPDTPEDIENDYYNEEPQGNPYDA